MREKGFSLFDLMLTVSGSLILIAIALPAFGSLMETYQLTAAAEEVATELQTARLLATSRNDLVTVVFLNEDLTPASASFPQLARRIRLEDSATPPNVLRDSFHLPVGVEFESVSQELRFDSRGGLAPLTVSPSNYSESSKAVVLKNNSGSIRIEVSITGRIRLTDLRIN